MELDRTALHILRTLGELATISAPQVRGSTLCYHLAFPSQRLDPYLAVLLGEGMIERSRNHVHQEYCFQLSALGWARYRTILGHPRKEHGADDHAV